MLNIKKVGCLCALMAFCNRLSDYFRKDDIQKVYELINSIPFRNTIIHGDYHPGNIMVSDDELILIDMGDVSLGHPIIDLLGIYQLMSLIPKRNEKAAMRYTGMTTDEVIRMWNIFIRDYIGTNEKKVIEEFERSLKCYALTRIGDCKSRKSNVLIKK